MNGGEGGMSTLDRAMLATASIGVLLIYTARRLRRSC